MKVVPLHRYFSPDHLVHVTEEMKQRGSPRIRAFWDNLSERWYAMEGTHRLRAAVRLGMTPIMIPVSWPKTQLALIRARHRQDFHHFS